MINIRRDINDPFYRYKMPKILTKVEGKGNGIKTVLPNISDIAKALHRPPAYPAKFFGYELGTMVKIDEAKDKYVVNGAHDSPKLQDILDGFITRFVLCSECSNPETDLVITKEQTIVRECKACGKVTKVEMGHRLCAFIVKNPPAEGAGARYKKEKARQARAEESGDESHDESADVTVNNDVPAKSAEKSRLDDWSVDVSSEAVAARMKQLEITEKTKKLNEANDDEDAGGDDPLEELATFVETDREVSNKDILAKIEELDVKKDKAVAVLVQTLFDANVTKQLPKRTALFSKLILNEKYQKRFLGGLERLVGVVHAELLPKIAVILKLAYDQDLLEEEVIIEWGKTDSRKYVDKKTNREIRKQAEPFLKWLETAEEESEEESDEESE